MIYKLIPRLGDLEKLVSISVQSLFDLDRTIEQFNLDRILENSGVKSLLKVDRYTQ